jgi:hypothetical protein
MPFLLEVLCKSCSCVAGEVAADMTAKNNKEHRTCRSMGGSLGKVYVVLNLPGCRFHVEDIGAS